MADDWASLINQQEDNKLSKQVGDLNLKESDSKAAATKPEEKAQDGEKKEEGESEEVKAKASLINKLLRSKLVSNKNDLEILQKDPNSPLYSVKSFDALHLKPELEKGVYAMGFNAPSKIQETALPTLLADPPQNMIAQSQSGTGKTAAFVLTMLSRVNTSNAHPQCLCLAPTFELALQIGQNTKTMSKFMPDLKVRYAVRGERVQRNQQLTDHIIIGTPGTVLDWCTRHRVIDLKQIRVFVLDEADVMIDTKGHHDQCIRIQRGLSKDCQMLLFSATYDTDVMKFAQAVVPNPVVIRLRREEESLENIKQFYIECQSKQDKFKALSDLYGSISISQCMIFCYTKKTAAWLRDEMRKHGHTVALLTGELEVEERAAVIERFREFKEKVLITTNVTARGIDIENVTMVVNFDLPVDMSGNADFETYLHRIGRTGRFGRNGIAINMVDGHKSFAVMQTIERHFGRPIEKLDHEDVDALEKITS